VANEVDMLWFISEKELRVYKEDYNLYRQLLTPSSNTQIKRVSSHFGSLGQQHETQPR
jgi:hypothetical protein